MKSVMTQNWTAIPMRRMLACAVVTLTLAVLITVAGTQNAEAIRVVPPDDPSGQGFDVGVSTTQAGGHPEAVTTFDLIDPQPTDIFGITRWLRDTVLDLPPGIVGNPEAVPHCPVAQLASLDPDGQSTGGHCPWSSQVGVVHLRLGVAPGVSIDWQEIPLYVLNPPPGVLAQLAFVIQGHIVLINATVRPTDHGIRLTSLNAPPAFPVSGLTVDVWGVPADESHDNQRCLQINPSTHVCDFDDDLFSPHNSGAPEVPFFTNPTVCDSPKVTTIGVRGWDEGPALHYASTESDTPTGCDKLAFQPSMSVDLDSTVPDSPTGISVKLTIPQDDNPAGLATAQLRNVKVTLPDGMSINPSSAGGLRGCSDEQIGVGTDDPVTCPDASKIGSVAVTTPVLPTPVDGAVYVGTQKSDDPQSGDMFRIFLVLRDDERNLLVKLPGKVRANPNSGQLETTFTDNPQLPVEKIDLRLKGGPRAPLATPPTCGPKTVNAEVSSWAGQTTQIADSLNIDCPGLTGFAPAFAAGTTDPIAGGFSPFAVRVDRSDRQEYIDGVRIATPVGLIAKLKGVPLCGSADATAGTCPAATRIGTATVGAGPGTNPFFLSGSVSLTEGYKGGPYGLSVAVHVTAGPFDLGMVVVRQAIYVDPADAHLTVISDPLPTIVKGVPIRMRSVNVDIDRLGFTKNPTSCSNKKITGVFHSQQGSTATVDARFQALECAVLPLSPKMKLSLTGKSQLTDGKHPGVRAVLTQKPGQANLKHVAVKLPLSLALDPDHAQSDGLCSFEESRKVDPKCPASSIVGRAKAWTPVLNRPLTGPVYFSKNVRISKSGRQIRTLPTLVIPLRGEVSLNLVASSDTTKDGKLVSTFATVPDAPVSRFELQLEGGRKGILVVNGNACKRSRIVEVQIDGQNGKRADSAVRAGAPCAKASKRK